MRQRSSGWVLLVMGLLASSASAQIEPVPALRFEYERATGAESCPDRGMMADAVSARLGYRPFAEDAARLLRAEVRREGAGYVATLTLVDETGEITGERSLEAGGEDCFELARAMELAITIAVDPAAITRPAPAPLPEEEGPPPPPEMAPPPPPSDTAPDEPADMGRGATSGTVSVRPATVIEVPNTDRPRTERVPIEGDPDFVGPPRPPPPSAEELKQERDRRWLVDEPTWQVSGWSGLTWSSGTAPAPTFGLTVGGLGLRYRFFSAQLELRYDLPQSAAAPSGKAAVVGGLSATSAHLCVHQGWMFGCGSAWMGVQPLGVVGVARPRLVPLPYLAAGGRAGADIPILGWAGDFGRLWRLRIRADVAAPMPFTRWRLRYDQPPNDVIWQAPPVGVILGAEIVFVLPP